MGKGTILSAIGNGEYTVEIEFNSEYKDSQIATLNTNIIKLQNDLLSLDAGTREYQLASLKILSLEKRKSALEDIPDTENITAWCTDLTEDLSGDIGTIEVPGESVEFNIRPGYNGAGVYDRGRDGFLTQTLAQTPEQAYFNASQLPGWQKWKPTFRYATVSNLSGSKCTVTYEAAESTQQSLPINQTESSNNVDIEYMECDGVAFADGDSVLVMFDNQNWSQPKVIGFKDNPRPCTVNALLIAVVGSENWCIVWNTDTDSMMQGVKNNNGDLVTFPVETSTISDWRGEQIAATVTSVFAYDSQYVLCGQYPTQLEVAWDDSGDCYGGVGMCDSTPPSSDSCSATRSGLYTHNNFVTETGATSANYAEAYERDCTQTSTTYLNETYQLIEHPGLEVYRITPNSLIHTDIRGYIKSIDQTREGTNYSPSIGESEWDVGSWYDSTFTAPFKDYPAIETVRTGGEQIGSSSSGVIDPTSIYHREVQTSDRLYISSGLSDKTVFFIPMLKEKYSKMDYNYTTSTWVLDKYFATIDSKVSVYMKTVASGAGDTDPFDVAEHTILTGLVQTLVDSLIVRKADSDPTVDTVTVTGTLYERE